MRKAIRYLYWLIVPILAITIGLATYFYADNYSFTCDYLSELGAQYTCNNGYDNIISSTIVSVGFGFCSLIASAITILYFTSDFRYKNLKGSLSLVIALGASLTAIPQDKGNLLVLHTIGAALFIGAFGILNFVLQLLRFIQRHQEKPEKRRFDFYLDASIVVLVFIVILLLLIFFIPAEITKIPALLSTSIVLQKLVLLVDCLALLVLDLDDI